MQLAHMTWPQAEAYFKDNDIILLSVGSIECHGKHLPLGTDTLIPQKLLEMIEPLTDVAIAPIIPFGVCDSLSDYPGTVSLGQDTLYQVLTKITQGYRAHGVRRFVVLNGHGGNIPVLDQVALDLRMYLKDQIDEITALVKDVLLAIVAQAENNKGVIMPGYTHLQRAQPILFSHHLMAYAMMLLRDLGRLGDCRKRMNVCPIGSCALAGTTYPTDRRFEARKLGFDDIARNSIDGVSDRDFCVELMSAISILMMHLSRFSEEIILWASWEFKFIELSDAYTTGSSIMPQKKNPDMAELVRGKTGRVYGDLMGLLTTLKGLPLAYNKDMQEDKEAVFDAVDTVKMCLKVFAPMLSTMTVKPETMKKAAQGGFINATDLADYLVKKGMPFRSAYKISGQIVARCIVDGCVLETLPLETYRSYSELFEGDLYRDIDLTVCVEKRISEGGTSASSVDAQIAYVKEQLGGGNV